ncbi:uncharacterized protein LOC132644272 [Lycium barbarum]|uniref:uncharacterized protein LOC132644272 n=1 Tax=Lycium barbarum TaxID=112863 RepID=UPI00293EC15B|nr:uncharacterized protein LOC132644272 [Lycium barbarum]
MAENTTQTQETPNNGSVDSSSPYYLHASDSPGMNLVNFTFDGHCYGGWKRSIFIGLAAKNKLGFIDGTCKAPLPDSPEHKLWDRCNNMVTSWLLKSLSKDIAGSVLYSKSARELWEDLEDRFGQPNGAKLYQLQKELVDSTQGASGIAAYYTKIKKI